MGAKSARGSRDRTTTSIGLSAPHLGQFIRFRKLILLIDYIICLRKRNKTKYLIPLSVRSDCRPHLTTFSEQIQRGSQGDDRDQRDDRVGLEYRVPIEAGGCQRPDRVHAVRDRVEFRYRLHPLRKETGRDQGRAHEQQRERQERSDRSHRLSPLCPQSDRQ